MIYYQGVAMTDGLNRKNHFFPFSTVVKSYHDVWNKPMPMNLGHDRSKPIGFTKLSGIYIEPGKAYVTNEACTTENKEEMEQLKPLSFYQVQFQDIRYRYINLNLLYNE